MEPLKVIPHADRASGDRHAAEKANSRPAGAGDATPPAQRTAHPAAPRANTPRRVELTNIARIARPHVTADVPAAQGLALSSGIRTLAIGLILVALVPNLTLAAVFWLGLINPPWSKPAQPPEPAPQAESVPAVLTAPAMLEATAGEEISFPLALDGTDGVPARSVIAISGLPQGSSFSDGRPYGETEWNLKPDQIGDLHLVLPKTVSGEIKLAIRLMTPDDKVITDAGTVLKVAPAPIEQPAPAPSGQAVESAGANTAIMRATGAIPPSQDDGAAAEEATPSQTPGASTDDAEAPTDKSDPVEAGEGSTDWVQPSAYVNLRDGPSSSSRIVGVIAKGAKVTVLERKRGWLQVTNPATSEKGWIYSGYVDGGAKSRPRTKRAAKQEPEQKTESSFWGWLSQ